MQSFPLDERMQRVAGRLSSGEGTGKAYAWARHGRSNGARGTRRAGGEAAEQAATKDENTIEKGWYLRANADRLFIMRRNVSPRSLEFFRRDHKAVLISTGIRS